MSIRSKSNRARRLKSRNVIGSKIRAAANKGRIDGLAQRADLSNSPCKNIEYWNLSKYWILSKENMTYRNARDASIMKR
jgi:hypothetical protein